MKNVSLLMLMTLSFVFTACGSDDEDSSEALLSMPDPIEESIKKGGIKPSGVDKISYITIVDSLDYKLAFGRKNNNVWVAKYNPDGSEVFSTEIKDIPSYRKYGHFNDKSIVFLSGGYLFLRGWFTNAEDLYSFWGNEHPDYTTFLSVIDFGTGKEIKRIKTTDDSINSIETNFKIEEFPESRFLLRTSGLKLQTVTMLKKGTFESLWERNMTESEESYSHMDDKILNFYGNYTFIENDKILYVVGQHGERGFPSLISSDYTDYCKIIDLKEPSFIFGFNGDTAPLFNRSDVQIRAFLTGISLRDDIIRINYKKCAYKIEFDPITDAILRYVYNDISFHYYDISADDYSVIDHVEVK